MARAEERPAGTVLDVSIQAQRKVVQVLGKNVLAGQAMTGSAGPEGRNIIARGRANRGAVAAIRAAPGRLPKNVPSPGRRGDGDSHFSERCDRMHHNSSMLMRQVAVPALAPELWLIIEGDAFCIARIHVLCVDKIEARIERTRKGVEKGIDIPSRTGHEINSIARSKLATSGVTACSLAIE